jgi:hypothetical protein
MNETTEFNVYQEGLFMAHDIEKRRCRRFEVPGMEMKFKKGGLLFWIQAFSEPYPVSNVSKGGVAFTCDEKLSNGTKVVVKLLIPDGTLLNLNSIIRRQEQMGGSSKKFTGVEFMPFGGRHGWNKIELLDVLRKLDKKYGGD